MDKIAKLLEAGFSQPDNQLTFDKRSWAGHDEFVVPGDVYFGFKNGREKHGRWNDYIQDDGLKKSIQKSLYSTGKCLITCKTTGASAFISHQKLARRAQYDSDALNESARSFSVAAIFLAAAGIAGKVECFASPALMGSKVPLKQGYVIQDTRSKGDYDKTVSVLVFNASKNVVGYIRPSDWTAKLEDMIFADDITLLSSEIPGMEKMFENAEMVFDMSMEFLKEGTEFEFTEEDVDYQDAVDHAVVLGMTEDEGDLFGQLVLCFLKWYNGTDLDVEESFEHAVNEIKNSDITLAKNDLTDDIIAFAETYVELEYELADEPIVQDSIHANTEVPGPEDAVSGDYKKALITVHGLNIEIENPVGSVRSGISDDSVIWSNTMAANYGYFVDTMGADGDEVDVFVGPHLDSRKVFIINQVHSKTLEFDEHKVMIGFNTENEAADAYHKSFDSNWKGFGGIVCVPLDAFKSWVKDGVKGSALNEAMKAEQTRIDKLMKRITEADVVDQVFGSTLKESNDLVDQVFGSSLNEAALSVYVGDDKDAATNAYFEDILNRWKQGIVKHSKKYKVENWKAKDKFVGNINQLEVSFEYTGKEGSLHVVMVPSDNANAFDFIATTPGIHGMKQPVRTGVRSYEKLVEDLEWYMMSVGV